MSIFRRLKSLVSDRHPLRLTWHKSKAFSAALRYGFPAKKLTVIGITGTDGKTTTVGMIAHILHERGIAVGSLTSAAVRVRGNIEPNPSQKTSPSPFVVQRFLRRLVDDGCTHAVLEYSSHGLVQGRLDWTWPTVAGITNTSEEHLDYHGTMEQYRRDKWLLFEMLGPGRTAVLNADDGSMPLYRTLPQPHNVLAYSPSKQLHTIVSTPLSCSADLDMHGEHFTLQLRIPGAFNLENALCAIGCALPLGIETRDAVAALATFPGTVGRMERIDEGQPFSVFIDFAITPQAMEKTLSTVRAMVSDKRALVLTGSCGDRMREKRPIIGKLCSQLADVTVITDDESYTEDPQNIMDEIWAGVDQTTTDAHRIPDRREAIRFILSQAKPGDAVVLCGLGSYPSRMTINGVIPWNEQEIVREILKKMHRAQ